jgi:hypothetical protein
MAQFVTRYQIRVNTSSHSSWANDALPITRVIFHTNAGQTPDLPHVIAPARTRMESTEQAAQWECVAGDFFTAVPAGGDCYLLKKVIHDWVVEISQL